MVGLLPLGGKRERVTHTRARARDEKGLLGRAHTGDRVEENGGGVGNRQQPADSLGSVRERP